MRLDRPFSQIATGDFDIAVVGQLPAANLPFGDDFESAAVKVVGFEAPFRRAGFRKQDLEDAPGNPHDALIFADADAELDDGALGVPPGVGRKSEKHRSLGCSVNVLMKIPQMHRCVESRLSAMGQLAAKS
jgi:hypothetical protein